MSLETAVAKKGVQVTWATVKVLAFVAMIIAICTLAYCSMRGAQETKKELDDLRVFKASVEQQAKVSAAATEAYNRAQSEAQSQVQNQDRVLVIQDRETQNAAREDKPTADFLQQRIPQRLRDADRKARQQR